MNQEEKEDLTKAGKLLAIASELAGDVVMLLGITGRMTDAGQAEVAMFQLGTIARKIGYIVDEGFKGEVRGR